LASSTVGVELLQSTGWKDGGGIRSWQKNNMQETFSVMPCIGKSTFGITKDSPKCKILSTKFFIKTGHDRTSTLSAIWKSWNNKKSQNTLVLPVLNDTLVYSASVQWKSPLCLFDCTEMRWTSIK
jgi:hypothetical protein